MYALRPRCFGFVTYESYDSVEDCLDYDRFHELHNGCVVEAKACQLPNPIHQYHALYHRVQKGNTKYLGRVFIMAVLLNLWVGGGGWGVGDG